MLPEFVKNRIEIKFGKNVINHKDCEILAVSISKFCNTKISTSTVKRLFGINITSIIPRTETLQMIGLYSGLDNWRFSIHGKMLNENSFDINQHLLKMDEITQDHTLTLAYANESYHTLRYLGENVFEIVDSHSSKLLLNDILTIMRIETTFPLICENVMRNGKSLGKFIGKSEDVVLGFTCE